MRETPKELERLEASSNRLTKVVLAASAGAGFILAVAMKQASGVNVAAGIAALLGGSALTLAGKAESMRRRAVQLALQLPGAPTPATRDPGEASPEDAT